MKKWSLDICSRLPTSEAELEKYRMGGKECDVTVLEGGAFKISRVEEIELNEPGVGHAWALSDPDGRLIIALSGQNLGFATVFEGVIRPEFVKL